MKPFVIIRSQKKTRFLFSYAGCCLVKSTIHMVTLSNQHTSKIHIKNQGVQSAFGFCNSQRQTCPLPLSNQCRYYYFLHDIVLSSLKITAVFYSVIFGDLPGLLYMNSARLTCLISNFTKQLGGSKTQLHYCRQNPFFLNGSCQIMVRYECCCVNPFLFGVRPAGFIFYVTNGGLQESQTNF